MIRSGIFIVSFIFSGFLFAQQKLATQYFELAQKKISEQDWPAAKDYLNQCLIATPNFAEGYVLRGEVNEKLHKLKESLTDYSIALELLPTLSDCYWKRGALAYTLDRLDLARSDFRRLLNIQDQETNMVYFRQSNNENVDKIFTLQSGIQDLAYNYLGLIETKAGDYRKSILYFDSAIRINPHAPDYYAHRGLAFLHQEEIERATAEFERALRLDPDHSISKNNLATIKRKQGRLEEAEKYLKDAKAISQQTPDHYGNLALLFLESGRYLEAIHNFDTAISLNPSDGELYINRGLAREKVNDAAGALMDFNNALRIDSEWPKAWFVQGNYFVKQKNWEKALENYTVALTYDENYALAYFNRAIVHFNLGKNDQACADLIMAEKKGMTIEEKMKAQFCEK